MVLRALRCSVMPTLARILISLCVGAAAILAWQSYGDAARKIITGTYPQLGWLVPRTARIAYSTPDAIGLAAQAAPSPDQRLNAISLDLDAMRQSVDRIAASQEQMTREITKLQAIEQYILQKNSEPPVPKAVPRPSQGRTAR